MNKSIRTLSRSALLAVTILLLQYSSADRGWGQAQRAHTYTLKTGRGVEIFYNGVDHSGMTLGRSPLLWVGQDITLTYNVLNNPLAGSRLSFSTWQVNSAGNPISGWSPTVDSYETASVDPVSNHLQDADLLIYYVAGGSSGLQVSAHTVTAMGGKGPSAFVNFIITRPTGYSSVATPGTVAAVDSEDSGTGSNWLEFGDDIDAQAGKKPLSGLSGMYITGTIPASIGGSVQWVQLIDSSAFGGGVGLDTSYPYPFSTNKVPYNVLADSPGDDIPDPDATHTRTDHFTSYFMWEPSVPNGIYVPLFAYQWGWSGTAAYNANTKPQFSLTNHQVFPPNLLDPITTEPTWSRIVNSSN